MATTNTVLSIFDHNAVSIAGMETFARELSAQLGEIGWRSVLVFASEPLEEVRKFLALPNIELQAMEGCGRMAYRPLRRLAGLLRHYRPEIMHLHFIPAKSGYPWLAKLLGVPRVYMHDHISRECPACTVRCLAREASDEASVAASKSAAQSDDTVHNSAVASADVDAAALRSECTNRSTRFRRMVNWLACRPVTKMFCVSSFVRDCSVAYGAMPPQRIELLYNGADLSRAESGELRRGEFRRRLAIPEDRVLVLQAGAVRQEKGVPDLLHAAKLVLQVDLPVHFLVAGDGPQQQEYQRLAEQLGIAARVSFSGRIRDPLGEGLWASCDIACQISRWQEAFGLTIAEAMAAGKPLIGTRIGAIPELIEDGHSGFLIEPGDVPALAEKIALLARDARQRAAMGRAGQCICREKFSLQTNVAALIGRYGIGTYQHGRRE
jgi:glycosyltransferase involved in cell wall biosynthesis